MVNLPTFEPARLERYLRDRLGGLEGSMSLEHVSGGQSNPTFFVSFANRRLVLRKKPPGNLLPSAHAIEREYRVMSALSATDVPVPKMVLLEAQAEVIGTPF